MNGKLWQYELTAGSFPELHYFQSRLAEIYRQWDVIQHVNTELVFSKPTNVLENPRIIVAAHNRVSSDINKFLTKTYSVIHVTDYKTKKEHYENSYQKNAIKLPWKFRKTDFHQGNVSQPCKCIIVTLTYHHDTDFVEGLEQFYLVHRIPNCHKELAVIVENLNEEDVEIIQAKISKYLKDRFPGWLTNKESQELLSRMCFDFTSNLEVLIQGCLTSSLFLYVTLFYDHCLQAFQMFDVLVEEEEDNAMKRNESRQKYLQQYKDIISKNKVEMEKKVKGLLEEKSEDILLREKKSTNMIYLKKKSEKEYLSTLWNRLLEKLSEWIFCILQAFVQEISHEFTQNTSLGNDIYSICEKQLTISSEKTAEYSASFLQSLKDILKNIWGYVFGKKEETDREIIQRACSKLKDKSDKTSHIIVKTYIQHHLESIGEQIKMLDGGQTCFLKTLKADSYKIKLQLNSLVRDIAEQNKQQVMTSFGQRLRTQVETEAVRNLLTRTKGVKSYRVHYDKLQISVNAKASFLQEFEKGLKTELLKHNLYDIDVVECVDEPTWTICVSSGDKILVTEKNYGTVGSLVRTHDGKLAFISAAHVLIEGTKVLVQKFGTEKPVNVGKCIWSQSRNVLFSSLLDLSLVELNDNVLNQIQNVGKHKHKDRWFPYVMYEGEFSNLEGKEVSKTGATSGYTIGTIVCKSVFPDPNSQGITLGETWLVEPTEEYEHFIKGGDSGSMVYIFQRHKVPQIVFLSLAQGQETETEKSYTSPLKQSIKRYELSTENTLHVNF